MADREERKMKMTIYCFSFMLVLFSESVAFTEEEKQCKPPCRKSYACIDGMCVSKCNPPCKSEEKCNENGECKLRRMEKYSVQNEQCIPKCRDGYSCLRGRCTSGCNPECPVGHICIDKKCQNLQHELERRVIMLENRKSPLASWALEFVPGFGIGHYYAGRKTWGAFGTVASVFEYGGLAIALACHHVGEDSAERRDCVIFGIVLGCVGAVANISSWIAAPILTIRDNREKVMQKLKEQKKGFVSKRIHFDSGCEKENTIYNVKDDRVIIPFWWSVF